MANQLLYDQWRAHGYAVVPGLIDAAQTSRLHDMCESTLSQWRACDPQTGQPGEKPDATVMRHLNHPAYFADRPERRIAILEAAADPRVLDVARTIFGEDPMFRCTSLFFNPSGVDLDGNWHRDAQFMTRTDDEERAMIAGAGDGGSGMQLQIALVPSEDIEVVPGSHLRWDMPEEYAIRKADGGAHNRSNAMPGAVRVRQGPGDAVLFNAMCIHRGRYRREPLRRTLMLTYTKTSEPWFDFFSDQPWFLQPDYLDGLAPSTRAFYDRFVGQYAPRWREKHDLTDARSLGHST
jgi:ectoine hydroxylase-related dioxygenase (phytanoyl-CoA dioxygenase family)